MDYKHHPFGAMHHNYNDDEAFSNRWEVFSGIAGLNTLNQALEANIWEGEFIVTIFEIGQLESTNYYLPNAYKLLNLRPNLLDKYRQKFRSLFLDANDIDHKNSVPINRNSLMIAIHIRLGDVNPTLLRHYTPLELYTGLVARLSELLVGRDYQIHIYSQGSHELWSTFAALGCVLHIDEDQFDTFSEMASADMIFAAKSTYSIAAAYFSDAQVFYIPSDWPVPSSWHPFADSRHRLLPFEIC